MSRREIGEPQLAAMMEHYPDFWEHELLPLFQRVYDHAGFDERTMELIVIALLVLRGWDTGIRVHARQALDAGATPDEIRGAALITLVVGGIHTAASGLDSIERALAEDGRSD